MPMKDKFPASVGIKGGEFNPDKDYEAQKKLHRSTIERLNHYFRVCTHPFVLMVALVAIAVAFCVFRIMAESSSVAWAEPAAEIVSAVLSYGATAVFSSVFTWFLENYPKMKDMQDDSL